MAGRRDLNVSISSNISLASRFASSTPAAKRQSRAFVRPICDTCKYCGKAYRCHRSFLKHLKVHQLMDAAVFYPKVEEIECELKSQINVVIESLKMQPSFGPLGEEYKELLSLLTGSDINDNKDEWTLLFSTVHCAIMKSLTDTKVLMPSSLIDKLQKNAEEFLSDIPTRDSLKNLLQACCYIPVRNEVAQLFIADYVFSIVFKTLKFVSATIRSQRIQNLVVNKTIELDIETKETIHYISGSVVRGFYKKSKKFPNNKYWSKISLVITNRLIESDTVPGPPMNVKRWTIAQNRGKLFFVSALVFDFFCGLTEILEKDSSSRGVNHELVLEELTKSALLIVWDDAISDSLSEDLSFKLMAGMVQSFSQTFGVGKAKKIINAARKKGEASLPLRHKVAPKK